MQITFKKIFNLLILDLFENLRVLLTVLKIKIFRDVNDESLGPGYSVIIFSKDRPMQLLALIDSYFYYCDNAVPVFVIYSTSNNRYDDAYKNLFEMYKDKFVYVRNDSDGFKKALIEVLSLVKTTRLFFLVDDILFKKRISISSFLNFSQEFVPSLRMGIHLSRCYTQNKDQRLPKFIKVNDDFFVWDYSKGELDWGYPLSVDGHIYYTSEIKKMTKAISFKAPNSYETKLQKFNLLFRKRKGVCGEISAIVNIPCNKVQIENENIFENFHQDELLKIFENKKIDFKEFENFKNESCHQELTFKFVDRNS